MKAYIQTDVSGEFSNVNGFVAFDGFRTLGWEIGKFHKIEEIKGEGKAEDVVVGGIGNVRQRLIDLGIERKAAEIDYPDSLQKYLGRKVWKSTFDAVVNSPENWGIFIKPEAITKKFTGKVVREFKDFIGLAEANSKMQVWCSEVVNFRTEWRCFIRYGEILDIRRYHGDWDACMDSKIVKAAIADFENAPAAYALDFGMTDEGKLLLIEVNDGHSLGSYGIMPLNYAKFLSARWAELTNTTDYLNF